MNTIYKTIISVAVITLFVFAKSPAFADSSWTYDMGPSTLKIHSSGQYVVNLQKVLSAVLYRTLVADGKFGQHTFDAVVQFQHEQHLSADGLVGYLTKTRLAQIYNSSANEDEVSCPETSNIEVFGHQVTFHTGELVGFIPEAYPNANVSPSIILSVDGFNYGCPSGGECLVAQHFMTYHAAIRVNDGLCVMRTQQYFFPLTFPMTSTIKGLANQLSYTLTVYSTNNTDQAVMSVDQPTLPM